MNKKNNRLLKNMHLALMLVIFLFIGTASLWADGSKDLYPSGAKGGRAALYSGVSDALNRPFPTRGVHYVYAKAGETIHLASSAQGFGSNNNTRWGNHQKIRLYGPNNAQITLATRTGNNSNSGTVYGNISGRISEVAGPSLPGQSGGNRYRAVQHKATVDGVYRVEFDATRTSNNEGGRSTDGLMANSNWTQEGDSNYIWAWDISVANSQDTAWIPGRVYTNVMNMDNNQQNFTGSGNSNPNGFFGKFKILTRDGYVYDVDNNGQNGLVFTFMVNNMGFSQVGNSNLSSYQSITATQASHVTSRYHDPRTADEGAKTTAKIFYTLPNSDMPEESLAAVPSGRTWLRVIEKDLNVTELKVTGIEGSTNQIGLKGAYIEFTNESGGDYYISIKPKVGSGNNFTEKKIQGASVFGLNKVFWDGTDGDNKALPNGVADVTVELKLIGAEVHFPYIDVEQNMYGIIIELLETDLQSARSDKVFWNDTNINRGVNGSVPIPINASHTSLPNGQSSRTNGHKWNTNTTSTSGTWGDERAIDTWTFIEGDALTVDFDVEVKEADLYTELSYSINGIQGAASAQVGDNVVYTVKAGNDGPSDIVGAPFTFTVPVGVDITNPDDISFQVSCANGTASESVAMTYNEKSRTFSSTLDLSDGCSITYTFTGTLNGNLGIKTAESTILRPNDVHDPDATNTDENTPPTNPHYECFNDHELGGNISCNNIQEATFMLLQACTEEYLYYEDFGRGYWDTNDGRETWTSKASVGLNSTSGLPSINNGIAQRGGINGGASSSYLFAPGQHDSRYGSANNGHSNSISVARIKNGYYSVLPPGYVQMGIPTTDPWHDDIWVPDAPNNSPDIENSNYDWTPAWTNVDAIRDISGAVNGSAFLVRGAASAAQSIKPFYEFTIGEIEENKTYTLSLYSYVTYHDKDYMLMDVVDESTGHIYASVPLVYNGGGTPPGTSPEGGFSLGWVPLEASFVFSSLECTDLAGKSVRIAIRGSQDRSLETGKGFGHTLIDDIAFTKRSLDASCDIPVSEVDCEGSCYSEVEGKGFSWNKGYGTPSPVTGGFVQPETNGGFVLDIYYLDNSFNMKVNGVPLHSEELEFQKGAVGQNVRFKSGGIWEEAGIPDIWKINQNIPIDTVNRRNNPSPAIRVNIDKWGNVSLQGKRANNAPLEDLEVFNKATGEPVSLNTVHWISEAETTRQLNQIEVSQNVIEITAMSGFGYGQNDKDCETCTIDKDGVFVDRNEDGFAQIGELITYTFNVVNLGDMDIYDIEIVDPLFGFTIKLDENTHLPIQEGVTLSGDDNNNGILDWNETWTFVVEYKLKSEDIFVTKGVYNQAEVKGMGKLPKALTPNIQIQDILSTDPTPYKEGDLGWDPERPFHTYVPLEGSGALITNPMIYQRIKGDN